MARKTIIKGPNVVHPERPSAVGSRNSLNRNERDEYQEAKEVIDEEVDKILNHIHAKLPPEVLEKLDVMGSIKSKLHNYFNQDFQNMLNRYLVTMEDEMAKKVRDLVDKEESRTLNRYTPREITEIIERLGAEGTFNTAEVEKSVVSMYGQLQRHIQRGVSRLETHTNALLREKSDVGAFIRGENSYAIAKCSFRDNPKRPKSVMDLKLSISIQDSELISPIYHYQVPVATLIKDLVAKNIHNLIDRQLDETLNRLEAEGKSLSSSGEIFERFRIMDQYVSDDADSEDSKRYQFVAKKFLDAVEGMGAEVQSDQVDALSIRENIKRILDQQDIRNRGFNTAVNAITSILDNSKMGYQFIENYKNARECVIREYEEEDGNKLPDERYSIRLAYYNHDQLSALRQSYSRQLEEMQEQVMHLWQVCDALYKKDRSQKGEDDWESLASRMLSGAPAPVDQGKKGKGQPEPEPVAVKAEVPKGAWNEITFIPPQDTVVGQSNPTGEHVIEEIAARFPLMLDKLAKAFGGDMPQTRKVVEDRLNLVRSQFEEFRQKINPYHIQPGLLLDIDIVSIKKKKTTMMNMANVINEFLYSVSKGFSEIPLESNSRDEEFSQEEINFVRAI